MTGGGPEVEGRNRQKRERKRGNTSLSEIAVDNERIKGKVICNNWKVVNVTSRYTTEILSFRYCSIL